MYKTQRIRIAVLYTNTMTQCVINNVKTIKDKVKMLHILDTLFFDKNKMVPVNHTQH